jgi:NACHT domain-containing protein
VRFGCWRCCTLLLYSSVVDAGRQLGFPSLSGPDAGVRAPWIMIGMRDCATGGRWVPFSVIVERGVGQILFCRLIPRTIYLQQHLRVDVGDDMLPPGLETALSKAAGKALAFVGARHLTARQRRTLATSVRSMLADAHINDFFGRIGPNRAERLLAFIKSPQFEDHVLQLTVWSATGRREELHTSIRDSVRHGLRNSVGFSPEDDLTLATDVVFELVLKQVVAARAIIPAGSLNDKFAVAISADMASAAIRNSTLISELESIRNIEEFSTLLRSQVAALRNGLSLTHIGNQPKVSYQKLYVQSLFEDAITKGAIRVPDMLATLRRCAVLGDPGAGKSTFAAKLAHDLAVDAIQDLTLQVPILFVVREHAEHLRSRRMALIEYLDKICKQPYNTVVPPNALEYLLLNGRVTVIVDGIDELGSSEQRRRLTELVEGFAHRYPLTRIVVTSRIVGYLDAPLDPGMFPVVHVLPFAEPQVEEYAKAWFAMDEMMPTDKRVELTQSFVAESSSVSDLRSNPLILSLLCALYSSKHYIPRHRTEVYEQCAELLFERWDQRRGIYVPLRFDSHMRPAVSSLAWRLFTDTKRRQAVPRQEMRDYLTTYMLERRFSSEEEARGAANEFLDFCAGRAWVLTEMGTHGFEPLYGFTHRTFLEYFTALQLVRREPTPEAVWRELKRRALDASWDVVAQLALQILDRQHEDGGDKVLSRLLNEMPSAGESPRAASYLAFAGRSVASVVPTNTTIARLTAECLRLAGNVPVRSRMRYFWLRSEIGELSMKDLPLVELSTTVLPDNASRVRDGILSALKQYNDAAVDSSFGILHSLLTHVSSETDVRVTNYATIFNTGDSVTAIGDSARLWSRLLFSPTQTDIEEQGVRFLYNEVFFVGHRLPAYAALLLKTVLTAGTNIERRTAAASKLAELYPAIAAAKWPWLHIQAAADGTWTPAESGRTFLDGDLVKSLSDLSPDARGAALLLMLPMFQYVGTIRGLEPGNAIELLAKSRYEPALRMQSVRIIEDWHLPKEAHALAVSWIHREESPIVRYS